jgi:Protein of unknown function (DUF4232)
MRASAITGRRMLAVCCLTSAALLAAACGGASSPAAAPARTATVTATPASPPASAPPASAPASVPPSTPPAGGPPCSATGLRLTVGEGNGAAGTIFYPLDFTNTSGSACTMYGYPGVAFVSSPGGTLVGPPAKRRPPAAPVLVTVGPGATAHATLAVSDVLIGNNCQDQVQTKWLQVYPPGSYRALFARLSRQGCADPSLVTMGVTTVSSGP